jgi:hypothetical protein
VGVVVGSKLNPVPVTRDSALGGDSFESEVLVVREPAGIEDGLQVEDQVGLRINNRRGGSKVGDTGSSSLLSTGHLGEVG